MTEKENVWLLHGDCLERMKEIPDGSVDMVLASIGLITCDKTFHKQTPKYAINFEGVKHITGIDLQNFTRKGIESL